MRSVILTMSLTGSVMYMIYVLLRPVLKKWFSVRVRIRFIICAIVFYLEPFPLIKNHYYRIINMFFGFDVYNDDMLYRVTKNSVHILSDGSIIFPTINYALFIVTMAWILVFGVVVAHRYRTYTGLRKSIIDNCNLLSADEVCGIVDDIGLNIKSLDKITFYSSNIYEAMTIGFIKPKIVLPLKYLKHENLKYMVQHEVAHIQHRDCILKLVMIAVMALHWFNPLVYFMLKEIDKLTEYYADEACVVGADKAKIKEYGQTIIDFSTKNNFNNGLNGMPISSFGNSNYKEMKERLCEMKKVKRYGKVNAVVSAMILSVSVVASSMVVFAYEDCPIVYESDVRNDTDEDLYFTPDFSEESFSVEQSLPFTDEISEFFVDEDGNATPIKMQSETRASCVHNYVSGTVQTHTKNSNGGCTVKTYSAQKCSLCGTVQRESLISTTTYTSCPH